MGIEVLAPDVNESFPSFSVVTQSLKQEKPRIRFGLQAVKNMGENIVNVIIEERKRGGPYQSLGDFLTRVQSKDLNKKSLESLAKCGALDRFVKRADILANIDQVLAFAKNSQRDQRIGQKNMFGLLGGSNVAAQLNLASAPALDRREELRWEKELLGLYISDHPLKSIASNISSAFIPIAHLQVHGGRKDSSRILCIINNMKRIVTRSGKPMLFVELEDTSGSIEGLVFPKIYEETSSQWNEDQIVILDGRVNDKDGEKKFIIQTLQLYSPDNVRKLQWQPSTSIVSITLQSELQKQQLRSLHEVLGRHPGPHRIHLHLAGNGQYKKIITRTSIAFSPEVSRAIEAVAGENSVRLETT